MAKWRDEKRRYRRYKARKEQLPASRHEAIDAVERYALRFGPETGDTLIPMLEALVERSAADGTSVSEVVGDDPVKYAETLLHNYPPGRRVERNQRRVSRAFAPAAVSDTARVEG